MKPKVAIITNDSSGWATMRKRWESHLPESEEFSFRFLHLENYAVRLRRLSEISRRLLPLWHTMAGRAAVRTAIAEGCDVIVLSTIHFAGKLNIPAGVRLLVYGDSTPRQYNELYEARSLGSVSSWLHSGLRRLARRNALFLCMSRWYAHGLRREYEVNEDQIVILPPYVDADYWTPRSERSARALRVLFLGSAFQRKGGDVALELARRPQFADCQFHFVTNHPGTSEGNVTFHPNLRPDTAALRDLVRSCDLLLLPTRADCFSIAVLECGACGLPAVVSAVGGIPEVVTDGVTGRLLREPGVDACAVALEHYRSDPAVRRSDGERARRLVLSGYSRRLHLETLLAAIRNSLLLT